MTNIAKISTIQPHLAPVSLRSITFKGQRSILSHFIDFVSVGPEKPLGYITQKKLEEKFGPDGFQKLSAEAKDLGLETFLFSQPNTPHQGVVYVYHPKALNDLLERNRSVLEEVGWSVKPEEFMTTIATHIVPPATQLYDLIADAFSDKDNTLRSDLAQRDSVQRFLAHQFYLAQYRWYPEHLMAEVKKRFQISDIPVG